MDHSGSWLRVDETQWALKLVPGSLIPAERPVIVWRRAIGTGGLPMISTQITSDESEPNWLEP